MSQQGTVRHVFPGANTPQGFYSRYDDIAPVDANKVFVLKGGPGVGKSTFMRKLSDDLLGRGFDVEFHHCSADNNSIDAIYIPAIDVALIDGTAPHVVDPKHPGAVDEIIHLGDYWDEAGLREPENKAAILRTNRECSFRFNRANDARKAAQAWLEEWKSYYAAALDSAELQARIEDLIGEILPRRTGERGSARRLFASAITYDGPKNWLASLFDGAEKRYIISGDPGTGKANILGRLTQSALSRGYTLDVFHCPMYPEQVDHLFIRELGTAVITSTWPHPYAAHEQDIIVDTSEFVDPSIITPYRQEIEQAKAQFHAAIEREIHHLGVAKKAHDEMERHYVPFMNFAAVEERRKATLKRILELAAERQVTLAD